MRFWPRRTDQIIFGGSSSGDFLLWSPRRKKLRRISMGVHGHGFTHSPSGLGLGVEKQGRKMGIIDLNKGLPVTVIEAPRNRHFYGHGVFHGERIYTSQVDLISGLGYVS